MGPRRTQTRQQHEAFMSKLDGKGPVERLRLLTLRKQYLDGERDDDVVVDVLPAPIRAPAPVLAPPRGKAASETSPSCKATGPAAPKQTGKKKNDKEEDSQTRKRGEESQRSTSGEARYKYSYDAFGRKRKERERVAREEKDGATARVQALGDLKCKRAEGGSGLSTKKKEEANEAEGDESAVDSSGCTTPPTSAAPSTQQGDSVATELSTEETPNTVGDASSAVPRTGYTTLEEPVRELPPASYSPRQAEEPPTGSANSPRQAARSLTGVLGAIDVANDNIAAEVAEIHLPVDSDDLNYDVDGDVDSDNWYTETEPPTARSEEGESGAQPASPQDNEDTVEEDEENDGNWMKTCYWRASRIK
ncbi:hypothetical protein V7S43_006631 [Phytophthora oleae]|uniref:Uncharacterized protein n=1 Tax=Phytophthora oleae TaxID=2107226 RepID=A0ABD3FP94_9STRA